ncbi:NUDIX hydrolase [Bacillaceae bacterium W0354]
MDRVDVVYALILNEAQDHVLMVKNVGSGWSLPGGAVEKGETLEEAMVREVKEETNLEIEIEHMVSVNEAFFNHKNIHPIFFTFKVNVIAGEIKIVDESEISDIKWYDFYSANELMPYHKDGIEGLIQLKGMYHFQG